jgi:hypothetical protein
MDYADEVGVFMQVFFLFLVHGLIMNKSHQKLFAARISKISSRNKSLSNPTGLYVNEKQSFSVLVHLRQVLENRILLMVMLVQVFIE